MLNVPRPAVSMLRKLRTMLLFACAIFLFVLPLQLLGAHRDGSGPSYGCSAGSGTCFDAFTGTAGTALPAYNSNWIKAAGTVDAYLGSGNTVEIAAANSAFYYYGASQSEVAQITLPASTTAKLRTRQACVRMQAGLQGYCVTFGRVSNGRYSGCPVLKAGAYIGNGSCASPVAGANHTLAISASGTSTATLQIYLDGVPMGSVEDSSSPYASAHPGFGLVGDGTIADTDTGGWKDAHDVVVAPVTSAPVLTPAGGTYASAQAVTLTSATPSTYFFYTTDGSAPTTASMWYRGPIAVAANTTLRAMAYSAGDSPSAVSTGVYTFNAPSVQTPTFSLPPLAYVGATTLLSIADSTPTATVLYCIDSTNTCTPSLVYLSSAWLPAAGYIRAQGILSGWTASAVASWHGTVTTLQVNATSCPPAAQYQAYAGCTLTASGGVPPYTFGWSTTSGDGLVEGLQISPVSGSISGTASGQGTYSIPFTVTDQTNATATRVVNISVSGDNSLGGCSLFPADSVWHMNVAGLPVDTSAAAPIPIWYVAARLHLVFGANVDDGGIPFLRVPYNQQNVGAATTLYQHYFTSGPFPVNTPIEGTANSGVNGDRHALILQTAGGGSNCKLWEMWQGAPTQNGWTDSSNAYWDLSSYNMLPQDTGSTDAAGLPVLPLLWNYDEVAGGCAAGAECGVVKHPGRLTLNHTLNAHVWPATAQAGTGGCIGGYQDSNRLLSQTNTPLTCTMTAPMGEIYRLKSSTASPAACVGHSQAQVLLTAMRNYGLIVADNGISGGVVATADSRWNDTDLACLTNLTMTDFEPVNVSSKMIDLNSSQVRQ